MMDSKADLTGQALGACDRIDRYIEDGNTIRAIVELRALLDDGGFWSDPDRDSWVRTAYLHSVDRFARRGVSESELNISLHA